MRLLPPWASSWASSQYTLCLVGGLLTSGHDEVFFIKAYSLKQTTIQQGDTHARQPDEEMVAAGETEGTGEWSGSRVNGSVERSEGYEQSLQGERGEQERTAL
jgi:hypothetical protein